MPKSRGETEQAAAFARTRRRVEPRQRRQLKFLGVLCVGIVLPLGLWLTRGPLPEGFLDPAPRFSTEVVDRRGMRLYESLSDEGQRGRWLSADALPETLVRATLAAEDRRFFSHPGVDPLAVARAAWHNVRSGHVVEGGSTLTQQVVKLLLTRPGVPPGPRGLARKAHETVLALRLENRLDKREILALYLSLAPYGNQFSGAEAASRGYFGCPPANLTAAQAAFLAGLPQRPGAFNPYRDPGPALARQRWVLARMEALGFLAGPDVVLARDERLQIVRDPKAFRAPHFVERVVQGLGSRRARRVETTLDALLQGNVQGILRMHRPRLEQHGASAAAVAVLDNASGEWLAWEGSGDYSSPRGGAIDGVVAPRQPGSALKPFTYALAFERGFTPASVLPDIPTHFATAIPGVLYSPRNYDGVFRGPLRARAALAGSENVPAVWTLAQVGVPDLLRLLRRAGLTTLDKTADYYGYGLTMGDAEVRLDEVVAAYGALARGGVFRVPRLVRRVAWADGSFQESAADAADRIVSERSAFWIADVLSDPRARAFIFGTGGSLDFPFPVAVKTGTSQSYRDNWTVGFTRDVTVGVWVGNFDRAELRHSSGVIGAAPIFHDVLLAAQRSVTGRLPTESDLPLVDRPADLVVASICALSGLMATDACPRVETEWLPEARARGACTWHRRADGRSGVAWPSAYRSWARASGVLHEPSVRRASTEGAPAAARPDGARARRSAGLRIVNPPPEATYLRDPTLPAEFQTLALRAVTDSARLRLSWLVDGRPVGMSSADGVLDWPLALGSHTISVTDGQGQSDEARILVK